MKQVLLCILLAGSYICRAQRADSIFFHLYTDSLKKGTYNYINVDGWLAGGRWLPLTSKEISFTASAGTFYGNCLFIDTSFKGDKVKIKAVLKENPSIARDTAIYIKKLEPGEKLKTAEEMQREMEQTPRRRRRG